jgi:HD-GYP domain-containing protein (c-di-GMP phosphodiesterase class II)/uncharacterized protein YjbI with pentapeptide repeats
MDDYEQRPASRAHAPAGVAWVCEVFEGRRLVRPGPTTGASESVDRSWQASRVWAGVVGLGVFVAPIASAWIAVSLLRDVFYRPAGTSGIVVWIIQAVVVASVVAAAAERVARRLLPLQVLLGMSLTFPDHAPSRFRAALRSGTLKKLKSRVPDISDGGTASVQQAAENAVELVTMLGKHERLTRGHTERVRAYSDLIAVELGLSHDERNKLAWAAMLHDIGKLAVPAEILNKDSRPTGSEWQILATHPSQGIELLAPLQSWLGDWLLAASEHHERWDGEGYPNGLSGLDISLAGRIVAVADAYDVITSHRSYKQPMSIEAARSELVKCSGTQFDPAIVRAMLTASKSDRANVARFAGLLELRTVSQALSSVSTAPAAVAAALVALPAVFGVPAPGLGLSAPTEPSEVAFVEPAPEEPSESQPPTFADSGGRASSQSPTVPTEEGGDTAVPDQTAGATSTTTTESATTSTTGPATTAPGSAVAPATALVFATTLAPTTTVASPTTVASTTTLASTTTVVSTTTTTTTTAPADDCERLRNGESDLASADLSGCDLSGLILTGVNLEQANLTGADLRNTQLSSFDLTNALLNDALLDGAELSNGTAVGITARGLQAGNVSITNVDLSDSTLMQSNFSTSDLTGVSFANSSLGRSSFVNSRLVGVDFTNSSLNDADFAGIDGRSTNFSATNGQGAIFDGADVRQSNFSGANLSRASFVDTDAEAVTLRDARVNQANLTGADLLNASGTPFQSQNATYDTTVCPDGVTRNTTCWP